MECLLLPGYALTGCVPVDLGDVPNNDQGLKDRPNRIPAFGQASCAFSTSGNPATGTVVVS